MKYKLEITDFELEKIKEIRKEYSFQNRWLYVEILDKIIDKTKELKEIENNYSPIKEYYSRDVISINI